MSLSPEILKHNVATAALKYLPEGEIIGMGTGSTVNALIPLLKPHRSRIEGIVASSKATESLLKQHGFNVCDPNSVSSVAVYFDGADEADPHGRLIKGGGGAHTWEKIIACMAQQFVCLIDERKRVPYLGQRFVPVEVLPIARSFVARQLVKAGADPVYRQGFITDQGNCILDVYRLPLEQPELQEQWLKSLVGVVDSGIFAIRRADIILCALSSGDVETLKVNS